MMDNEVMVTVVVPTKNCADSIEELLCALKQQKYRNFEVIVVDSSDDETEKIASSYNVKTVRCPSMGLNIARNTGIRESSGKIICLTDGDCTMGPDWLSKIVSEFTQNSRIGCVGGSVLSNSTSFLGRYYSEAMIPIYPIYSKHFLIVDEKKLDQPFGEARFPAGCNIAFKREALNRIGGFNSNWRNACEESEMLYRLLEEGYFISINPEILVYHRPRQSIIEATRQTYSYGLGAGTFSKTENGRSRFGKRIASVFLMYGKTIFHSTITFKKKGNSSAFLYPLLDFILGISYYSGFIMAYLKN